MKLFIVFVLAGLLSYVTSTSNITQSKFAHLFDKLRKISMYCVKKILIFLIIFLAKTEIFPAVLYI